MNLRLSSPAGRGFFVLFALASATGLSYSSIRAARGAHFAELNTREGYSRSVQLEPTNPRYWNLLGDYQQYNLEDPDPRRAIQSYRTALSLDPRSAGAWLDLGSAYEAEGDLPTARDAFVQAKRVYPISAEVFWQYGNFLLRRGELDEAFELIRQAVEANPKHAAEAFSRGMRADPDIETILNRALPSSRDVYANVIEALTREGRTQEALTVWSRLAALRPLLPLSRAMDLVDALIDERQMNDARRVWDQATGFAGIPPPLDPPGSAAWDGGFESGIAGGGFAWRYPQNSEGVEIRLDTGEKHSGNHSLRLTFDGKRNVNFTGVCKFTAVQPSASYRFSAWVRTKELTTDQGVRFLLQSIGDSGDPLVWTEDVRGTGPWTLVQSSWTAGKDVRGLKICVGRTASARLENQIQGTAWIDDISLVPESAASRKP